MKSWVYKPVVKNGLMKCRKRRTYDVDGLLKAQ